MSFVFVVVFELHIFIVKLHENVIKTMVLTKFPIGIKQVSVCLV